MRLLRAVSRFARSSSTESPHKQVVKDVVVAIGSNQVTRYSRLYETAPAYVLDQAPFLNAAILLKTSLLPEALLRTLKSVEAELGRKVEAQRWGPRPIDLDIIFYHGQAFSSPALEIPHPRWHERSFVLAPLADLLSHDELHAPASNSRPSDAAHTHTQQQHTDINSPGPAQSTVRSADVPELQQRARKAKQQVRQQYSIEAASSITSRWEPGREHTSGQQPPQHLPHHIPVQAASQELMQDVLLESGPQAGTPDQQTGAVGAASAAASDRVSSGMPGEETAASNAGSIPTEMAEPGLAVSAGGLGNIHEGLRRQLREASRRWRMWQARAMEDSASGVQGQGDVDIRCVLPLRDEKTWAWEGRSHVMGILNITPDSFSDGGQFVSVDQAVDQARKLVAEGANMLDVGGQSTRPHADRVTAEEELKRVLPVIRALARKMLGPSKQQVLISIDTFYASVAAEAVQAGAHIVNDVSGGSMDPAMYSQVAALGVPYIIMHMRGTPSTMQDTNNTFYRDTCAEAASELNQRVHHAIAAGIKPWLLVSDPGIGFSKMLEGNLELMAGLRRFRQALLPPLQNMPILAGPSRKRFLGNIIGSQENDPKDRATAAAASLCVANSANIIRAHNAAAVREALTVTDAICATETPLMCFHHRNTPEDSKHWP